MGIDSTDQYWFFSFLSLLHITNYRHLTFYFLLQQTLNLRHLFLFDPILVLLGCSNKISQTGWFKNNANLSLTFLEAGRAKIKVPASSVQWGPTSWFIDGYLLAISSHGRWGKELSASLLSGTCLITQLPPKGPTTLISSFWGWVGFQCTHFGRTQSIAVV